MLKQSKKVYFSFLIVLLICGLLLCLSACGAKNTQNTVIKPQVNYKYSIVVTCFPIYDWVKEIVGNDGIFDVIYLQESGVDLHNYEPTIEDIEKIVKSDLFIYIGGQSDEWVKEIEIQNKINALNLMNVLSEAEIESDEHLWLSLRNAKVLCESIRDAIIEVAPESETIIENNCLFYTNQLLDLDKKYTEAFKKSSDFVFIFADRFPFFSLFNDYDLKYVAAYENCFVPEEVDEDILISLSDVLKSQKKRYLFVIAGGEHKIADKIIEDSEYIDIEIVELNIMESVTSKNIKEGFHYMDIMKSNLNKMVDSLLK